jgi:hypothetical protein
MQILLIFCERLLKSYKKSLYIEGLYAYNRAINEPPNAPVTTITHGGSFQ